MGRSADSVYDLLSGLFLGTPHVDRFRLLPLSLRLAPTAEVGPEAIAQLRANLAADGLAPASLMRRTRPVSFVDLVAEGTTFGKVHHLLRQWIDEQGAQWDVIRRKVRYVGITIRRHTSPRTWRWQQQAAWTTDLPPSAIANVSLDARTWSWLGNSQPKTAPSFRPSRWLDPDAGQPARYDEARAGLAEAIAVFRLGQQKHTKAAVVRALAAEPTFAEPWLRALALDLR